MAESSSSPAPTPTPKKRRSWLRLLAWIAGAAVILVVVLYFVATSSAFLRGVILPRVSAAINADVTVSSASIHPFKQVVLHDLKVQAKGQEPLVTAPEVRLNYSLFDIIGGNIHVDEIAVVSPTVELVENPDGSNNLDPILKALQSKPNQPAAKPAQPSTKPSKPLQIDLRKLTLSNVTLVKIKNYAGGKQDVMEVTNLNLTLANVKNGQTGSLDISAMAKVDNNPPAPGTNGLLAATLKGNFSFALTSDLKPGSAKGDLHLNVDQATGAFADCSALGTALNCEVTPTDIKQLALQFSRNNATLGELSVSGPFDAEKMEGNLNVTLSHLDKQVLNLVGAASGIDFGSTTIDSTNQIQLSKAGASIQVAGGLNINQLQVTLKNQTTPTLDFHTTYDVALDRTAQTASLRQLNLAATENGSSLLDAKLSQPMNLALGNGANAVGDASLDLALTHLNLADWKAFTGSAAPAGDVNLNLKINSQSGGKKIGFDLASAINDFSVHVGTNVISQADINLKAQGQAADMKQISLDSYQLQLNLKKQSALDVSGSGSYNLADGSADFQVKLQAALAQLLAAMPQPGMNITAGDVNVTAHLTQKDKAQSVVGDFGLTGLSGNLNQNALKNFSTKMSFDVAKAADQIAIHKVSGSLSQDGKAGGTFDVNGTYETVKNSADIKVNLAGINQNAVGPFLQTALADKKLVSVDINAALSAQYDAQGASAVKGNLQVTNLVVNDPQHKIPATPLETKVQLDASLQNQTANLHQFQITLTPTDRAQNQVDLQGQVNFSQTTNIEGNLKLTADSLDMTRYYDLFAAKSQTATTAPTATAGANTSTTTTAPSNQEPPPMTLPFKNFAVSAAIGKFYLHEMEITNLLANIDLNGSEVQVKPLQLALNGAPINASADVNLGVPGYQYDVSLNAKGIPILPLANSFVADANGKYNGLVNADVQVKGQGITGVNLKKSLDGHISFVLTNANIQLVATHTKIFFIPINVQLIATLLNIPEIMQSPLDGVNVQVALGEGQINVQQAKVLSPAFEGNVHGSIPIADVLNDSPLNLPVEVSLADGLASKLTLGNAQHANGFTQLPVFVTVTGTIGHPDTKKNTLVIAGLTAGAVTGVAGKLVGGKTGEAIKAGGNVVQGIESLFGGNKSQNTNSTSTTTTNAPAKKFNPFGLFK